MVQSRARGADDTRVQARSSLHRADMGARRVRALPRPTSCLVGDACRDVHASLDVRVVKKENDAGIQDDIPDGGQYAQCC